MKWDMMGIQANALGTSKHSAMAKQTGSCNAASRPKTSELVLVGSSSLLWADF